MKDDQGKVNLCVVIVLLVAGFCSSLYALFAANPEIAKWIVNKTGYYFVAVPSLLFVYTGLRSVRFEIPKKPHLIYLLAAVAASAYILFLHDEPGPKIAMDDYSLSSTAKSLAMEREVEVLTQGRNFNGYFIRANHFVDKRPWLYPFVVSLAHDLTGYRLMNGFLVNSGLAIILLALTAMFGYKFGGLPVGVLGPFLWASLPLLSQNAMGGGLDMLNLLLLFVVMLCGLYYIKRPDAGHLSLLVLSMVLLSYTRYESILFWPPVLLVIAIGWYRERRIVLSYCFSAGPLLLFGLAALINHNYSNPAFWELPDMETSRFNGGYVLPNLYSALYFFLNMGDELGNSFLLGAVGIPCLILFFLRAGKSIQLQKPECFRSLTFLVFGVGILGHFMFIMAFYHGQLDNRITSRFSLPLYLLLVVSILMVLASRSRGRTTWWVVSTIMIVSMLGITLPNKAKGIYSKSNFVVREAEWLEAQADELFEPMSLVVDTTVMIWTLNEWHCINPAKAVSNLARLDRERARGKFPEIYWVERSSAVFDEAEMIQFDPDFAAKGFEKFLIAERSFSPLRMTRIYRVGAIQAPESSAQELAPSADLTVDDPDAVDLKETSPEGNQAYQVIDELSETF